MGKGGTKFDENAIGHRNKGGFGQLTGKEARKNMETFLRTGVHPMLQGSDREVRVVQLTLKVCHERFLTKIETCSLRSSQNLTTNSKFAKSDFINFVFHES